MKYNIWALVLCYSYFCFSWFLVTLQKWHGGRIISDLCKVSPVDIILVWFKMGYHIHRPAELSLTQKTEETTRDMRNRCYLTNLFNFPRHLSTYDYYYYSLFQLYFKDEPKAPPLTILLCRGASEGEELMWSLLTSLVTNLPWLPFWQLLGSSSSSTILLSLLLWTLD